MTRTACSSYCTNKTSAYFGLQYGSECFCGSTFGAYGMASSDSTCNSTCLGELNSTCGGIDYNSVYATKYGIVWLIITFTYLNVLKWNLNLSYKDSTISIYMGCYNDNTTSRDISDSIMYVSTQMNTLFCVIYCRKLSYSYAALQNGYFILDYEKNSLSVFKFFVCKFRSECRCSWSFGKYGIADSDDTCNIACSGNPNQFCGGYYLNSIYATSILILVIFN